MSWSIGLGGALSLQLHEEWVVQQKCHPMYQTNVLCGSMTKKFMEEVKSGNQLPVRGITWEETMVRRRFPYVLPDTELGWWEFERRCWWLGVSILQGAELRRVNRLAGLNWP